MFGTSISNYHKYNPNLNPHNELSNHKKVLVKSCFLMVFKNYFPSYFIQLTKGFLQNLLSGLIVLKL